jgi:hypothetical protein
MTLNHDPILASDRLQAVFKRDERLIDIIASHSPQLARLRHSPMRRVMASVTTVAQAARLCRMPADALVRDLNRAIGIDAGSETADPAPAEIIADTRIPAFGSVMELDVREELSRGGEPFSRIMAAVAALGADEALHLRAPFEPVPLFGVMQKRGFEHRTERHADDDWSVWFFRDATASGDAATAQPEPRASSAAPDATDTDTDAPTRPEVWLDVRDLEPPEPLVRTLEALESLPPDAMLVQVNARIPQFLLPILRERGFHFTIDELRPDEVQVRIWRAPD